MLPALIPAAGKSTRMGRCKLLLPLGGRSILEHVIESLRKAQVGPVVAVVGPHVAELAPLAEKAGACVCQLVEDTPDMRATVQHGLRWLDERFHPAPADAWLLVPADQPTLDAGVVQQLVRAREENPNRSIFIPTYQGQRGHPTLLSWGHVPGILKLPEGTGLNIYIRDRHTDTLEVPVSSAEVLHDLDTPEDYERMVVGWQDGDHS